MACRGGRDHQCVDPAVEKILRARGGAHAELGGDLLRTLEIQVVRKIEGLVNLDPRSTFAFHRDQDIFGDGTPDRLEVDPLGTVFAAARWASTSALAAAACARDACALASARP